MNEKLRRTLRKAKAQIRILSLTLDLPPGFVAAAVYPSFILQLHCSKPIFKLSNKTWKKFEGEKTERKIIRGLQGFKDTTSFRWTTKRWKLQYKYQMYSRDLHTSSKNSWIYSLPSSWNKNRKIACKTVPCKTETVKRSLYFQAQHYCN